MNYCVKIVERMSWNILQVVTEEEKRGGVKDCKKMGTFTDYSFVCFVDFESLPDRSVCLTGACLNRINCLKRVVPDPNASSLKARCKSHTDASSTSIVFLLLKS